MIETTSVSDCAPPDPALPWSFVVKLMLAEPLKFDVGVKVKPFKAALMLAAIPVKTIVELFEPLPVVNVNPVVWLKDIKPFVDVKVTCRALELESTSLIDIWLLLAAENVRTLSSLTDAVAGTWLTGASLTELTVIETTSVSDLAPPEPVLPWSFVVMLMLAEPL